MSLLDSVMTSPLTQTAGSLVLSHVKGLRGFFADVVIEEHHTDELNITEHPVEYGANISDHAYMSPPEVTIKIGWSASSDHLNGMLASTVFGGATSLISIYETLQMLQRNKVMLSLSTGKRLYTSVLIKSLAVSTELQTENAMIVTMTLKKIFMARTKQTALTVLEQKLPQVTDGVTDRGEIQMTPATNLKIMGLM